MSKPVKVLIVMEGPKREKPFIERLVKLYGMDAELYVFHTNIYVLYQAMKKINFQGDIRDVLAGLPNMQGQDLVTLRETKFAYTYLIFDCDAQDTQGLKKGADRSIDNAVKESFTRLREMAAYFTDETDPAIGKLYVNYPMMESYRDCDSFFDENYRGARISIDDLTRYKQITERKRLASIHLSKFTKENFADLLRMNVYKLNAMLGGGWGGPAYQAYRALSDQDRIAAYQEALAASARCMDVLNTTLLLLTDYYGNRDGFYDSIVFGS